MASLNATQEGEITKRIHTGLSTGEANEKALAGDADSLLSIVRKLDRDNHDLHEKVSDRDLEIKKLKEELAALE